MYPLLTDHTDINVLHDIVTHAQASSDTGTRALFDAYEKLLPKRDIESNKDAIFTSFLLHMREGARRDEFDLKDQFTAFLEELGFEVIFDEDDLEHHDGPEQPEDPNATDLVLGAPSVPFSSSLSQKRRRSFDESYNGLHSAQDSRKRPQSPDRPRSQNDLPRAESGTSGGHTKNSRRLPSAAHDPIAQPRARPIGRKAIVQIREEPSIYEFDDPVLSDEVSATDEDEDISRNAQALTSQAAPAEEVTQLAEQARRIRHSKLAARAHRIFHSWLQRAQQAQSERISKLQKAATYDSRILRKQTLDHWRQQYYQSKQQKETEAFFDSLGTRAEKARDLFLLTKAFTHWAQSTSEAILRTSTARKNVLRTRYFNAWLDITAVNELKVRRQGLSRFFQSWRRRSSKVSGLYHAASDFQASNLNTKYYRGWFWKFCEQRAPGLYDDSVTGRYLEHWSRLSQHCHARDRRSQQIFNDQVLRKILTLWISRANVRRQQLALSDNFHRKYRLIHAANRLRRKLYLDYPERQVARRRVLGQLRETFNFWLTRAEASSVADRINKARVMRNAWTNWNDTVRSRALSHTIDDRVTTQSLYKWVLAERLALYGRIVSDKMKADRFAHWRVRLQRLCSSLGSAEHSLSAARKTRVESLTLRTWHTKVGCISLEYTQPLRIAEKRVIAEFLRRWVAQYTLQKELRTWSQRSDLLLSVKPLIKIWKNRLEETRRQRRRDAFFQIKESQRRRLLDSTLDGWLSLFRSRASAGTRADSHYQQQRLVASFGVWASKRYTVSNLQLQANGFHEQQVKIQIWHLMYESHQRQQLALAEAEELRSQLLDVPAVEASLRSLETRLLQIESQRRTAETLRRRNDEKHQRMMLRHWSEQAHRGQHTTDLPFTQESPSRTRQESARTTLGEPRKATNRQAQEPPVTGTPGYLRTPLRRTAGRFKSQLPVIAATPGPAFITPFMNRLEAQYPSGVPRSDQTADPKQPIEGDSSNELH